MQPLCVQDELIMNRIIKWSCTIITSNVVPASYYNRREVMDSMFNTVYMPQYKLYL